ncbi:MAG: EF-P lysine aminoacylase EpmA [Pseudomonadota bacterium]
MAEPTKPSKPAPWWDRARHADRRPVLLARQAILAALRAWFTREGFIEVDTALLQVSPGNETHLHAFVTQAQTAAGATHTYYLPTSPEFAMKKLLAAGETRLFTFAPAFRNRERGSLHAPQFTMLEWYRADATYEALMDDCAAILATTAHALEPGAPDRLPGNAPRFIRGGRMLDATAPLQRVSVTDAFAQHAGIDLGAALTLEGMREAARQAGMRAAPDDTWSDLFAKIITAHIEPALGVDGAATLLVDYPLAEAALARRSPRDPRFAERFELYAFGIELVNAFSELTDAAEQRARFEADMAEKQRRYGERYPIDEAFLDALSAMPPAAGAALGFDRLVMIATGAPSIDDVMWTPIAR